MKWLVAALAILWQCTAQAQVGITFFPGPGTPASSGTPTNIFTQSLSSSNSGNSGGSLAQEVTLSGNPQGHINVTLTGAAGGFTATNIYICTSTGSSPTCTATPTQVLFSGSATVTVPANSSVTSDFAAYSTAGTDFVVCYEITADGAEAYQTGLSGPQQAWGRFGSNQCSLTSRSAFTMFSGTANNNLGVTNIQTKP